MPWTDADNKQVDDKLTEMNVEYQRQAQELDRFRILRDKLQMLQTDPKDIDGTPLTAARRMALKNTLITQADALINP